MNYCLTAFPEIDRQLRSAKRILLATDFDGTLCPIADDPSGVHVAPGMGAILRQAVECPRLMLAVISGRALADVRRRLAFDITIAGNHGLEISGGGLSFEHSGARQLRPRLAEACEASARILRAWPTAWVEDKGLSATLHFRKVDQRQHHALLFTARRALGPFGAQLALRVGNRALEVRPKVQWDKGNALQYIQKEAGPFNACVCIGDDQTDETMFRANSGQLNIRIGRHRPTAASHYLSNPAEVAILISHIVDICSSEAHPLWNRPESAALAVGCD